MCAYGADAGSLGFLWGSPCSWWLCHLSSSPQAERFSLSPSLLPSNSCKTGHEAFHLSPVMTPVAAAFFISHVGHHSDFLTSPLLHDRVAHLKWSLTVSLFCWKPLSCSPLWTGHSASSFCISFQDVIQPRGWSHLYWACHIQNTEQLVTPSTCYLFLSPTFMSFLNVVLWLVCHLSCREN